jgi:hypothetical protein
MHEVKRVSTPFTADEVAPLIVDGLRQMTQEPYADQCALLLAQMMLETANGSACFNHNPGNMSAAASYSGEIYRPVWYEVDATSPARIVELHKQMLKGKAPSAFRSYPTLEAGTRDHFSMLGHVFPMLLAASRTADPLKFSEAIRSSNYTPGINVTEVAHSLEQLQRKHLRLFPDLPLVREHTAQDLRDGPSSSESSTSPPDEDEGIDVDADAEWTENP